MSCSSNTAAFRKKRRSRFGMSLLELLAVIPLMGIFSAAAVTRFGRDIFGDTGVKSEARKISLGMLSAQRGAIRTGDRHGVVFDGSLSQATQWTVVRELSGGAREIVDGPHTIADDFSVSVDSDEIMFDFEGNGTSTFQCDLQGPHRSWRITILPLTRMIDSFEITP